MKPIVLKTHPKAIIPTKRQSDAGFDLYAVFDDKIVIQKANEMMIFNTKLKMRFDTGYVATIKERGSTRLHNLNVGAGVVEGNYAGEYLIMMTNLNEYIDIVYSDGEITPDELAQAMCKAYSTNPSLCKLTYVFRKDTLNRTCVYEVMEDCFSEPYEQLIAYIYPQSKAIAQMVVTKKEDWEYEEVDEETFNSVDTDRGEGRFGSSNK